MDAGRIVQVGTPHEVYERPATRFVADFIGIANILRDRPAGRWLALRPEKIALSPSGPTPRTPSPARIVDVAYEGDRSLYRVATDGRPVHDGLDRRTSRAPAATPSPRPGRVAGLGRRCRPDRSMSRRVHLLGARHSSGAVLVDKRRRATGVARPAEPCASSSRCPTPGCVVFFLLPFALVLAIAFGTNAPDPAPPVELGFSLAELHAAVHRRSLPRRLAVLAAHRRHRRPLVTAAAGLSDGLRHRPRRRPQRRPLLLMLVILPFWTSFLIRVYAWMGLLAENGILNQFLRWTGLAADPGTILGTEWAVHLGIVYAYLPFMVLPLYATLEKLDLEPARGGGRSRRQAARRLPHRHPAAVAARHRGGLPAGLHPGGRRVRDPRPAGRHRHADDRQGAVGRVLHQRRLAARLGGGDLPAGAAGRPDRAVPAPAGRSLERRAA